MDMRNLILIVLSIFCVSAKGQTLQVDNFKTSLNHYETLCRLLLEDIEYIKKHDKELNMKAEPKTRVMTLINKITNEINSNDAKNDRFLKQLKELRDSLSTAQPQSTVTPTTEVGPPVHNPTTTVRGENPKVEENEGNIREENGETTSPNPLREVRGGNTLENYLSLHTLEYLHQHRDEVEMEMNNDKRSPHKTLYTYVMDLFEIQDTIYNRNHIKDLLAKISSVQNKILDKHRSELDEEIMKVNDYRYATKELLRLFGMIDNPTFIKKDATSSKFDDDNTVSAEKLEKYFEMNKKETEYVDKFVYTKKKFEEYLTANAGDRSKIKEKIEAALAN